MLQLLLLACCRFNWRNICQLQTLPPLGILALAAIRDAANDADAIITA